MSTKLGAVAISGITECRTKSYRHFRLYNNDCIANNCQTLANGRRLGGRPNCTCLLGAQQSNTGLLFILIFVFLSNVYVDYSTAGTVRRSLGHSTKNTTGINCQYFRLKAYYKTYFFSRSCGGGFCEDCSTKSRPVPERGWGDQPVRVCEQCFERGLFYWFIYPTDINKVFVIKIR